MAFEIPIPPNAAILNNHNVPVLTFVRSTEADPFVYYGVFRYRNVATEPDGAKWFELARDAQEIGVVEDAGFNAQTFAEAARSSGRDTRANRLARLAAAPKLPPKILMLSTGYKRNPDVVAEVLFRAAGECEGCGKPAPFSRSSDGSPYLEVHHRLPLAMEGEDTVENAIALCPNCHRRAHFGQPTQPVNGSPS